MKYYLYNTDAQCLEGDVRFPILVQGNFAATGGVQKYGIILGKLEVGDWLLMYENKIGVVAIGSVYEPWDGVGYKEPRYYDPNKPKQWLKDSREYRIGVNWTQLQKPITFDFLGQRLGYKSGWVPRRTIGPILRSDEVKKLIDELLPEVDPVAIVANASRGFGGGESESHKALKEYVLNNPSVIGLKLGDAGEIEYPLPSGDSLDVSFTNEKCWVAAEVKSSKSGEADITRGLFQCVKYRAVMDAVLRFERRLQTARSVLVLEGRLPQSLVRLREELGVEVIEGVVPPGADRPTPMPLDADQKLP